MLGIKKLVIVLICITLALSAYTPASLAAPEPVTRGEVIRDTTVYRGKGEDFPVIGELQAGDEIDVYEYDDEWVLTRYEAAITYEGETGLYEFYGYVKRNDVDIDTPLMQSTNIRTNQSRPGKRQGNPPPLPGVSGKKPSQGNETDPPGSDSTEEPENPQPTIPVEDLTEYDWIIRTPGTCKKDFLFEEGKVRFTVQFDMMVIKFGGYTASSLPVYNDGNHNPYTGYVSFSLKQDMSETISQVGIEHLEGVGGINLNAFNGDARFFIDSPVDDGTRAIFTVDTITTGTVDPTIRDYNMGIEMGGELFNSSVRMPLDIRLEPSADGYKLVVLNMKPGGGDVDFPAMLEKIPLSDTEKAERERIQKEKNDELTRKAQELWRKVKKSIQDDLREKLENESGGTEPPDGYPSISPLVPKNDGGSGSSDPDDYPSIPPLVPKNDGGSGSSDPDDYPSIPPLVPKNDGSSSGSNPDDYPSIPPLVPRPQTGGGTNEEPDFFPDRN
ncbi:MAG: hypothetical protein GXX04_06180 [Clostridiaceae bacterium]|nr:hypothetical protein [Clostridiaceae bacterium]